MSVISQTMLKAKPPLRVGITGGIGSGKTTVCRIFEQLGIPVYYADERAKVLMNENSVLRKKITKLFGPAAYLSDGKLDRNHIASIVFQDAALLEKLNGIVHPAVMKEGESWHNQQQGVPYTLKESALLFEIGSQVFYDKTVVVFAPKEIRLHRVMQRDGLPNEAVEARMSNQMDEVINLQHADFVIFNDGSRLLIPQVLDIHRQLLEVFESS